MQPATAPPLPSEGSNSPNVPLFAAHRSALQANSVTPRSRASTDRKRQAVPNEPGTPSSSVANSGTAERSQISTPAPGSAGGKVRSSPTRAAPAFRRESRGLFVLVINRGRRANSHRPPQYARQSRGLQMLPLLHYSTTPLLHYSTTPLLHYSTRRHSTRRPSALRSLQTPHPIPPTPNRVSPVVPNGVARGKRQINSALEPCGI
jgi:hypothetical protein